MRPKVDAVWLHGGFCQPKSLGGLGLHDLHRMNIALRTRWLWFNKVDNLTPPCGSTWATGLWEDPWINGLAADAIAPDLLALVRSATRQRRSVRDGLFGNAWLWIFQESSRLSRWFNISACGLR
jgi:hypothetical protein